MSVSANEFLQENDDDNNTDSETNPDDDGPDYYQPISADDDDDENNHFSDEFEMISSNGHIKPEIGIQTLDLDEEAEETIEDEETSNSEISRAFTEDENRRNAPLTPENSNRIMNAMRGISFQAGFVPDWINQVPDDRWIDHLTNLRQQQPNSTSTSHN